MKHHQRSLASVGIGLLFAVLSMAPVHAQQFSISAGSVTSCSGVIEDTGGPTGTYGNNKNLS